MPYVLLPGPAAMRWPLLLDHSGTTGYRVFVIQHFKEYLAGYIIRIVAGQDKGFRQIIFRGSVSRSRLQ